MSLNSLTKFALSAFAALALSATAQAVAIGDANYLGFVNPGLPAGDAQTASYVQTLIDLAPGATLGTPPGATNDNYFERSLNVFANLPDAEFGVKQDNSNATIDVTGWTYLLAKYGVGSNAAGTHVWYVGDLTGVVDIPATFEGNGLSHSTLLTGGGTTVPDGGTTAVLLGLGLVAISFIARRRAV